MTQFSKENLKYSCSCLSKFSLESKFKNKTFSARVEVFFIFLTPLIALYLLNITALITIQVTKRHGRQEMLAPQRTHARWDSTSQGLRDLRIWFFWLASHLPCSLLCPRTHWTWERPPRCPRASPRFTAWSSVKLKFDGRPIACKVLFEILQPVSHGRHSPEENERKRAASLARKRSAGVRGGPGGTRGGPTRTARVFEGLDPDGNSNWVFSQRQIKKLTS